MSTTSPPIRAYLRGVAVGAPFLLVAFPFGMVFGVAATEAGLNLAEVMGFSVLVIAGAAQFTALQLMTENAPAVIVLVSALAVNLRMVMYSASLSTHLIDAPLWQRVFVAYFNVDQTYAASVLEYDQRPQMSLREKIAFFFGAATPICPALVRRDLSGRSPGHANPSGIRARLRDSARLPCACGARAQNTCAFGGGRDSGGPVAPTGLDAV